MIFLCIMKVFSRLEENKLPENSAISNFQCPIIPIGGKFPLRYHGVKDFKLLSLCAFKKGTK